MQDAEVAKGSEALDAYLNKNLGGAPAVLKSFSTNLFDNPMLKLATDKLLIVSIAAFLLGMLILFGSMKLLGRKK